MFDYIDFDFSVISILSQIYYKIFYLKKTYIIIRLSTDPSKIWFICLFHKYGEFESFSVNCAKLLTFTRKNISEVFESYDYILKMWGVRSFTNFLEIRRQANDDLMGVGGWELNQVVLSAHTSISANVIICEYYI